MATPLPPLSPPTPPSSYCPFRHPAALSPHSNLFLRPKVATVGSTVIPKSTASDQDPEPDSDSQSSPPTSTDNADPFESRLAQVRLRYRSGTGKKAEIRKEKKGKRGSAEPGSSTGTGGSKVLLPPVPLKEPVSGGLKVEFGFSPFSEQVNGRLAGLGLLALVLVELATGQSVIKYHKAEIVFVQVYFMAAVCAVYLKFEKEKVSVWPLGDASSPPTSDS